MSDRQQPRSHRILVIDDNPAIHDDFRKVLCPTTEPSTELNAVAARLFQRVQQAAQHTEYEIDSELRGQDGVERVRQAIEDGRPYALAFVDMRMPNGWNGLETTRRIWQMMPNLNIVLCTAFSDFSWDQIRHELPQQDRFFILKKPFDNIEVQQLAESLTARAWVEAELRARESGFNASEALAGIGHFSFDARTGQWRSSDVLGRIFGVLPSAAGGYDQWMAMIDPAQRSALQDDIDAARHSGEGFERDCRITRRSDGQARWVCVRGRWERDRQGPATRLVGTFQDITQARESQHALQLLDACVSHIGDALIVTDAGTPDGHGYRIVFVNDAFVRETGYSREEALGRTPKFLQGPKTSRTELDTMARGLAAGQPVSVEIINYKRNGEEFWVALDIVPVRDQGGRATHFVATQRNVTARIAAESRQRDLMVTAREAQTMDAVGVLAGGIAHDINNGLAVILGSVARARAESGDPKAMAAMLQDIERAARRARSVVDEIVCFSQDQPLGMAALALQPLAAKTASTLGAIFPVDVVLDVRLADEPTWILGDADALVRVLMNIGINACNALQQAPGRVDIGLDNLLLTAADERIGLQPGRHAHLWIRDSGCGMSLELQQRIFEPFFTTRGVGTGAGMGLAVAHGIVHAHGGVISVDSAPGLGTTVHVYLPRIASPADLAKAADQAVAETETADVLTPGKGKHLLYVDDDELISLVVEAMLTRCGYRVTTVPGANEALQLVRQGASHIDLIVTDNNMPGRSGLDLIREVAALRPDLPVVLTSGFLPDDVARQAREAGAQAMLRKERLFEDLTGTVSRLLAGRSEQA